MSRPPKYGPEAEQLLKAHPEGITTRDISEHLGCSIQQAYKIVRKLRDDDLIRPVGQSPAGGDLLAWGEHGPPPTSPVFVPAAVAMPSPEGGEEGVTVRLGGKYTVTAAEVLGCGKVKVTLTDEDGDVITVER